MPTVAGSLLRSFRPELGTDFWDRRFAGGDDRFDLLEIRAAASLRPAPEVPDALAAPEHYAREDITYTRLFELSGLSHIKGRKVDLSRIDELVQAGATAIWEVRNAGGTLHNFQRPRRELRRAVAPRPQPVVAHGRVVSRVSRSSLRRKAKKGALA